MIPRGIKGANMTKDAIYLDVVPYPKCKLCGAKEQYHGYCEKCWLTAGKDELIAEFELLHAQVEADKNYWSKVWRGT